MIQKQGTGTHSTELHVLTAASNYTQYSLHTGTALGESDQYMTFDIGRQGDLIAVQRYNTGSGSTEVHILSAASGYQTFVLHTGTKFIQAPTGATYHVLEDSTGKRALTGVQYSGTGTNTTEVHILNFL